MTVRNDLDISVPGIFESVWLDVFGRNGSATTVTTIINILFGLLFPFFQRKLEGTLSKLSRDESNFYIIGDLK